MRIRPAPASPLYPKLRFAFTDHPITVWAGVILLRLYVELLGLRTALTSVLTPVAKTSHHQIPVSDVLLAWWYGLALGAERFEHLTRYRRDPLLSRLLGLSRFPSPDTVRRFFGRFTYRHTTEVSEALMRLSLKSLRPTLLGHTLDLDSTVFCRYGEHEGSLIGHNPIKHGRPSHHPLLAWLSERRRLLWATLRAGHAGTANGVREFLAQALTMLPAGHRIGLVRADAGFCVTAFFTALEARELPYIIVARLTPLVRKLVIHRIPDVAQHLPAEFHFTNRSSSSGRRLHPPGWIRCIHSVSPTSKHYDLRSAQQVGVMVSRLEISDCDCRYSQIRLSRIPYTLAWLR